eukprot:scaffold18448_cov54-Phaeocystis_antarctica.AAC.1
MFLFRRLVHHNEPPSEPTRCLGPHPLSTRPRHGGQFAPRLPARRQPLARRVSALFATSLTSCDLVCAG